MIVLVVGVNGVRLHRVPNFGIVIKAVRIEQGNAIVRLLWAMVTIAWVLPLRRSNVHLLLITALVRSAFDYVLK